MLNGTDEAIRSFSKRIGVAPGIVVGRMQYEKILPWNTLLNRLKVRYEWNHGD